MRYCPTQAACRLWDSSLQGSSSPAPVSYCSGRRSAGTRNQRFSRSAFRLVSIRACASLADLLTVAAPGYAVSAVGEESSHVLRTHGSQRSSHRLDEAPLRALAPISLRMYLTLAKASSIGSRSGE